MMRRHLYGIVGLIVLGLVSTAVVSAQDGPPPPISPPTGVGGAPAGQPSLSILQRVRPPGVGGGTPVSYAAYPYDFQFADRVVGYFFKPSERVTITVANVSTSAVTVTADRNGAFAVERDFVWRFCGPDATRAPAPIFRAAGDRGSRAQVAEFAPPCPELAPLIPQQAPVPSQKPVIGTVQPVGTIMPVRPGIVPPPSGPYSQPEPVYKSQPEPVELYGFGFVAGERVTVTVRSQKTPPAADSQPAVTTSSVTVTADSLGRLHVSVQVALPSLCSGLPYPVVTATGNKGTSFTAPLFWIRPMAHYCPVHGAPVSPGTGDSGSSPAPTVPALSAGNTAATLSVKLQHMTVRRGQTERATIQAGTGGAISLSVSYSGHAGLKRTLRTSTAKSFSVRWRVPRTAHPGHALVRVVSAATGASLQVSFRVK